MPGESRGVEGQREAYRGDMCRLIYILKIATDVYPSSVCI
jgi:hypothetical protein